MKLRLLLNLLLFLCCTSRFLAEIDTNVVNKWNEQAMGLAYSKPKRGMEYAEKALQAARRIGFSRGEVRALIRKGIIYDVQSKNKLAIDMYEQSLALSRKTNDKKGEASNLNNLGLIYWKINELYKALKYFNQAYNMFRNLDDEFNQASAANNIGLIYEELQLSRKALSWHRKAIEHGRKAGDEYFLYAVYSNIGNTFESLGRSDSSEYYNLLAIEGQRKTGDQYGLSIALNNLGTCLNSMDRPKEAIPRFKEAMEIALKLESPSSYVSAGYNLSSSYAKLGMRHEQQEILERIYPVMMELKGNELGYKICFDLARCYYRTGNIEKGEEFIQRYRSFQNAYSREILNKNISEAERKLEIREERERHKLKLQQEAAGRFMDNVIWTASLAVLLLAGLLVFFVLRKRNLQRELVSQKAVFDATMEERRRISYDLHDHVGSQLSYVVSNLELIQHQDGSNERVQRTFSMSQAAMSSLRDTVWALHTEELTLESLTERMENVARKTTESSEALQLVFDRRIEEQVIIPQQTTMHVMRIFQEAVHNVVKHAKARRLTITIDGSGDEVLVRVADNGVGIASDPQKPFHFGLQSMSERALKIGGKLSIQPGDSGGTIVELTWPKNNPNA